jgi:hypothetical protein
VVVVERQRRDGDDAIDAVYHGCGGSGAGNDPSGGVARDRDDHCRCGGEDGNGTGDGAVSVLTEALHNEASMATPLLACIGGPDLQTVWWKCSREQEAKRSTASAPGSHDPPSESPHPDPSCSAVIGVSPRVIAFDETETTRPPARFSSTSPVRSRVGVELLRRPARSSSTDGRGRPTSRHYATVSVVRAIGSVNVCVRLERGGVRAGDAVEGVSRARACVQREAPWLRLHVKTSLSHGRPISRAGDLDETSQCNRNVTDADVHGRHELTGVTAM